MTDNELLKRISEGFAQGDLQFCKPYLADNIRWSVLGESTIVGKKEVLEASKMQQLQAFPVITIKNVVAEGEQVVVESTGKAKTKVGSPMTRPVARSSDSRMSSSRR